MARFPGSERTGDRGGCDRRRGWLWSTAIPGPALGCHGHAFYHTCKRLRAPETHQVPEIPIECHRRGAGYEGRLTRSPPSPTRPSRTVSSTEPSRASPGGVQSRRDRLPVDGRPKNDRVGRLYVMLYCSFLRVIPGTPFVEARPPVTVDTAVDRGIPVSRV